MKNTGPETKQNEPTLSQYQTEREKTDRKEKIRKETNSPLHFVSFKRLQGTQKTIKNR